MLGGYQILDLRSIDLSRGTSEASISDASVLAQLLNIRDHIQKTYDFSKPLHAQLKPLLIRYRDKKVGEKHEVALYGNIEVINTYYKFRIIASNEGEQLTINVEFEEKTDEYDNKYWDIKTATILLTVNQNIKGDLVVDGVINSEWEEDIDLTIRSEWLNGLTLRRSYTKLLIKNGVMYFVLSIQLSNQTEATITTSNSEPIFRLDTLKDSIASKIYRKDGTNLLENSESASNILTKNAYRSTNTGGDITAFGVTLNSDIAKSIYLYPRSNVTIGASEVRLFDFRVFITL